MSQQDPTFPNKIPLNGSDYFQIILDRHHRQYSKIGNVCRLGIFLKGTLDEKKWEERVLSHEMLQWMSGLRLQKTFLFQLPAWKYHSDIKSTYWKVHHTPVGHDLPASLFYSDINPYKACPFHLDLVIGKDGNSTLFLTWTHILMDSHGAELLLRHLHEGAEDFPLQVMAKAIEEIPLAEQVQKAKEVKGFLLDGNQTPLENLQEKPRKIKGSQYRIVRFTEEETLKVAEHSKELKIRLGQSPLLLGAAIRSVDALLKARGITSKSFWIPIPQDQRRKGANGPLIGNQVSFLFYRLFPNQLKSLADSVAAINKQMMDQMRSRMPAAYHAMMHLSRRMPLWLFERLAKSPTKGKLSSFFFSDTGHLFPGLSSFDGMPVKDAIHYPPNPSIPGVTIVFSIFQQKLQAIIAFAPGSLTPKELDSLHDYLREELLEV